MQWGSEHTKYQTRPVLKWSKVIRLSNGPIIEWSSPLTKCLDTSGSQIPTVIGNASLPLEQTNKTYVSDMMVKMMAMMVMQGVMDVEIDCKNAAFCNSFLS